MNLTNIEQKAIAGDRLNFDEALHLYKNADLNNLMHIANKLRFKHNPEPKVGWIIDRNVNYTNICNSHCKFCNFYVGKKSKHAYITKNEEYEKKINELFEIGGDQLLLQGGMHPDLGLDFYIDLFSKLKSKFPNIKLHALGPPEVVHIAKIENKSFKFILEELIKAGLDSLPGAGAEVLVDRVRDVLSYNKCNTQEWLDVMREAHKLGLTTSATMMFGHVDTAAERIEHLFRIREVQDEKPDGAVGFISFIPWPFQAEGTVLQRKMDKDFTLAGLDYIRLIAISRIVLDNFKNIQASWLTVGKEIGQLSLHAGANDFGSIMIEENVVSVAGADHRFDVEGIQRAIKEAGFEPYRRTQQFVEFEELGV